MLILICFIFLANAETKKICFTSESTDFICTKEYSFVNINSSTNFSKILTDTIESIDTDVYIYLTGSFNFHIPLNILNEKNVNIITNSTDLGSLDTNGIRNININIISLVDYTQIKFLGSFTDNNVSIYLNQVNLTSETDEIRLSTLSVKNSSFLISQITLNYFDYLLETNKKMMIYDNQIKFDEKTIIFSGDNQTILLRSNFDLEIDNYATNNLFIPKFVFQNVESVIISGNDFDDINNYFEFNQCQNIVFNISKIPKLSIANNNIDCSISIKNSFILNAEMIFSNASIFKLKLINNSSSERINGKISNLILDNSKIWIMSSKIDLIINSLIINSKMLPIGPCIGYESTSTTTVNMITNSYQNNSFSFDEIDIMVEIEGFQTDETLSKLMSQEWTVITIKSMTNGTLPNKKFSSLKFPRYVYGFTISSTILTAWSTVTDQYNVIINASSFLTIPLKLCYTTKKECSYGHAFHNMTELVDIIPPEQKEIELFVKENDFESVDIDLRNIRTRGASFKLTANRLNTLKMCNKTENSNIDHLVVHYVNADIGEINFFAKKITIFTLQKWMYANPTINFAPYSVVDINAYNLKDNFDNLKIIIPNANIYGISVGYYYECFQIYNDRYRFGYLDIQSGPYFTFMKKYLPNVTFHVKVEVNKRLDFLIECKKSEIDSLKIVFDYTNTYGKEVSTNLTIDGLININHADNFELEFLNGQNITYIDLNDGPKWNFLNINAQNYKIINNGMNPDSNLCACKGSSCDNCGKRTNQVTYEELPSRIQYIYEDAANITIIGDNDGTFPILLLDDLDNKDVTIIGNGSNPIVQLNSIKGFQNISKKITISNITIVNNTINELYISNLNLYSGCILDSTFSISSLNVSTLICYTSHLSFAEIFIQNSFDLKGDITGSNSTTIVNFEPLSNFTFMLPSTITIHDSKLEYLNLVFDLNGINPTFSLPKEATSFNIIGIDGNIETLNSDIHLYKINYPLHINGTWTNANSDKYFIFNSFNSNLYLNSENAPIKINSIISKWSIFIGKEIVSIAGYIKLYHQSVSIIPMINENIIISINEVIAIIQNQNNEDKIILNNMTNITMNIYNITYIGKPSSSSYDNNLIFIINVGIGYEHMINIINEFSYEMFIRVQALCTVSGYLSDPKVKDFINSNHTFIKWNENNYISGPGYFIPNLLFVDDDKPNGFINENFDIDYSNHQASLITIHSPLEQEINLSYYIGNYQFNEKYAKKLYDDDFNSIEKFLPGPNSNVTIFFRYIPLNYLNFDKENISIHTLTIMCDSDLKPVRFKLSKQISKLILHNTNPIFENNMISIPEVVLNRSYFPEIARYEIQNLTIDYKSFFNSNVTEYNGILNIIVDEVDRRDVEEHFCVLTYSLDGIHFAYGRREITINTSVFPKTNIYLQSEWAPCLAFTEIADSQIYPHLIFNSIYYFFSDGWDKNPNVTINNYEIIESSINRKIYTRSFPIYGIDFVEKYPITLYVYSFKDIKYLVNQSYTLSFYNDIKDSNYDISFNGLIVSGNSSIFCIKEAYATMRIYNITVKENSSIIFNNNSIDNNIYLYKKIVMEPGSSIKGLFLMNSDFSTVFEWNLDQMPHINSVYYRWGSGSDVYLVYKGSSIKGREKEFEKFFENNITLISNYDDYLFPSLKNYHFISDIEVFNDSDKLALKVYIDKEEKKLKVSLIDASLLYYDENNSNDDDYNTDNNENDNSYSSMIDTPYPIQSEKPIETGPSINDNFNLSGSEIEITENGYKDGDNIINVDNENDNVILVKADKSELTISSGTSKKPVKEIFVSPQIDNARITISSPNEGEKDYGESEFGIHANSKNPTVILPQTNVPLNIFNNQESKLVFEFNDNKNINKPISLEKLTMDEGSLEIVIPEKTQNIEFKEVEVFSNGTLETFQGQTKSEIAIGSIKLNKGSNIKMFNIRFNQQIKSYPNSKIEIDGEATFSDTSIEITDSSLIELGNSHINGLCSQIILTEDNYKQSIKKLDNEDVKLICGVNFDCELWANKYIGNSLYPKSKCIKYQNEKCLSGVNNKTNNDDNEKSKPLSAGAIAAIVVVIVVVVVGVIVGVIIWKKSSKNINNESSGQDDENLEL